MKLSKVTLPALFIVITLASGLKITGTIGYYALFTDDFVERFCENVSRPELQCEGKCALSKMLLQEAEDDKRPINLDWLKNETVLFIDSVLTLEFLLPPNKGFDNPQYCDLYSFCFAERLIHPPRF